MIMYLRSQESLREPEQLYKEACSAVPYHATAFLFLLDSRFEFEIY